MEQARVRQAEADRQGRDVDISRYHAAARASEVGQVTGRVYEDGRKPNAAETPLAGTILMVLPRSETWLATLETIRAQSRDSLDRYRDAAPAIRRAREALERALLERGGGDLPQSVGVNAGQARAPSAHRRGHDVDQQPTGARVGHRAVPASLHAGRARFRDALAARDYRPARS
jgi:hypothetical protein